MVNRVVAGLAAVSATLAVVGMGLGYSGAVSFQRGAIAATAGTALPYHACPEGGAVGHLSEGDRVLLTGRDDDGSWVQVRAPHDLTDRVWIRSDFVEPDEAAELPLADCAIDGELEATSAPPTSSPEDPDGESDEGDDDSDSASPDEGDDPEVTPTPTSVPGTTVPGATTTTVPATAPTTTQPPSTTPTTAPTTTTTQPRPSIGAIGISNPSIVEADAIAPSNECSGSVGPTTSVVSSTITNADTATLNWSVAGQSGSIPMARQGSTFTATVGPFGEHTITAAQSPTQVALTITAVGPGGQRQSSSALTLTNCEPFA